MFKEIHRQRQVSESSMMTFDYACEMIRLLVLYEIKKCTIIYSFHATGNQRLRDRLYCRYLKFSDEDVHNEIF